MGKHTFEIEFAGIKASKSIIINSIIKKVEGPFGKNDDLKEELLDEIVIGKTYMFKSIMSKESEFKIEDIKWAEQLDSGDVVDIQFEKGKKPYINEDGDVCCKYRVKDCKKLKIYAYITKPINKFSVKISEVLKPGRAILIAFPDQNPKIPENQGFVRWAERFIGNGNGKIDGAGHAGIIIIKDDNTTRYFDFGRYKKTSLGNLPADTGTVRSSSSYVGLRVPNWKSNLTADENVRKILTKLHNGEFVEYGTIMGSLAKDLDYDKMLTYALSLEKKGYHPFGGYHNSTNIKNATYCAKFARGVAKEGGFNWDLNRFSGEGNVKEVKKDYDSPIIIMK